MKPEDSALFTLTELVLMSGLLAVMVRVVVVLAGVAVLVLVEAGVLAVEESVGQGVYSMVDWPAALISVLGGRESSALVVVEVSFSEGFHGLHVATVGAGVVEAAGGRSQPAGAVAVLGVVPPRLK